MKKIDQLKTGAILSYILLILTMYFICVKNRIMIFYNFRQRIHLFLPVFVTFRSF